MIRAIRTVVFTLLLGVFSTLPLSMASAKPAFTPTPIRQFAASCADSNFFELPRWCKYFDPSTTTSAELNDNPEKLWLIGAAVLEILLYVGGIVSFAYLLVAAFRLVVSNGDPGGNGRPSAIAKLRTSIVNAFIGLTIVTMARALVSFIASTFAGSSSAATGGGKLQPKYIPGVLTPGGEGGPIGTALNLFFAAIAAVSVVMIVIGGIKYVTSSGDPSGVNSAKNTILFAIIGVVLALVAMVILRFVVGML